MEAILQQTRRWDLPLIEQGRAEGRAEGEARGRAEGEARVLRRLLRLKFGDLPATLETRLTAASTDQIELWADRVLTAATLAEVFDN